MPGWCGIIPLFTTFFSLYSVIKPLMWRNRVRRLSARLIVHWIIHRIMQVEIFTFCDYASEEAAFTDSREWLRKVFFQLRHGAEHEGKTYVIDAPYCIKVEFHESRASGAARANIVRLKRALGALPDGIPNKRLGLIVSAEQALAMARIPAMPVALSTAPL